MIRAEGVWKVYHQPDGPVKALRDVSLRVGEGEFVTVSGESGSGKSTLLALLGAVDTPTRGEILFRGEPLSAAAPGRLARLRLARIGFVFQDFFLVRHLTAQENVMLPAALAGSEDPAGRARDLLEKVGLAHRRGHRPSDLSRGEMQRVALARALVNSPEMLIADEPTASLDRRHGDAIWELILKLNAGSGLTVIAATHSPHPAAGTGRVVELREGRVIADRGSAS